MSHPHRRNSLTPFSRHDFYDNTYLQRLRKDIQRLDNSHSAHHNRPNSRQLTNALTPSLPYQQGAPATPYLPGPTTSNHTATHEMHALSPDGRISRRNSRSPNPRSTSTRSTDYRAPNHRSPQHRSPNPTPSTPNFLQSHLVSRKSEPCKTVKSGGADNPITNVLMLPSISKQPHGAVRGVIMSREKSNIVLRASLQKKVPFPKIGMSELPSLAVTMKSVRSQKPGLQMRPGAAYAATGSERRMSRKEKYLYELSARSNAAKEITHGQRIEYDRLAVSPSNVSVSSARSVAADSTQSADELSVLRIKGEKLTPHCSPLSSPHQSPHVSRGPSPYINVKTSPHLSLSPSPHSRLQASPHVSPKPSPHASPRASPHISPRRLSHGVVAAHNVRRLSPAPFYQHVNYYPDRLSPANSPQRISPALSHHQLNPSHSPDPRSRSLSPHIRIVNGNKQNAYKDRSHHKGFHSQFQRRLSDLSVSSLNDDVSLKNFLHYNSSQRPGQYSVSPQPVYTPVSVAAPLLPRSISNEQTFTNLQNRDGLSSGGVIFEVQRSPSLSRQSSSVRDMGTQTSTQHEVLTKPHKNASKSRKAKKYKVHQSREGNTEKNKEPSFMLEREKPLQFSSDALMFDVDQINTAKQAVIVMKTTTTVRPSNARDRDMEGDYSRESTIHIDIAYNGDSSKSVVTNYTSVPADDIAPTVDGGAIEIPQQERRPSIGSTGPIPEIRMICATPEQPETDSPTPGPSAASETVNSVSTSADEMTMQSSAQVSHVNSSSTHSVNSPSTSVPTPIIATM